MGAKQKPSVGQIEGTYSVTTIIKSSKPIEQLMRALSVNHIVPFFASSWVGHGGCLQRAKSYTVFMALAAFCDVDGDGSSSASALYKWAEQAMRVREVRVINN